MARKEVEANQRAEIRLNCGVGEICPEKYARAINAAKTWQTHSRLRYRFIGPTLLGDTAWDLFLELFIRDHTSPSSSLGDLARSLGSPVAITSRWVAALEQSALLARTDHEDRLAGTEVKITDYGKAVAVHYFDCVSQADCSAAESYRAECAH